MNLLGIENSTTLRHVFWGIEAMGLDRQMILGTGIFKFVQITNEMLHF